MKKNIILEKSVAFAISVISFSEDLEKNKKFVISKQILRSGTSIGANIHESQNAESRADFIHKLKIAAKELEETKYRLLLCENVESYPYNYELDIKLKELGLILYKIISSSKKNI